MISAEWPRFDLLVVGAGSAGCTLAGRLAARGDRSVGLVEAGPQYRGPEVRSVASLAAAAPDHPLNWAFRTELVHDRTVVLPRGRVLGGSSAINGCYFARAVPADFADWAIPGWSYADVLPDFRRSEQDLDFTGPAHGSDGPIRVRRSAGPYLAGVTTDFLDACAALGYPAEEDKNAGGAPGAGLVPSNAVDGVRVSAAMAYLPPPWGEADLPGPGAEPHGAEASLAGAARPGTEGGSAGAARPGTEATGPVVLTGTRVLRVLLDGQRAVGVETTDGPLYADQTVLCAGAVGTPNLLLHSGIGPAETLAAAGIELRHELPGVGAEWSDHPAVFLPFRWTGAPAHPQAIAAQAALNLDTGSDPAGDVEILLFARPFVPGGELHLMCSLQQPRSRGVLTPAKDPLAPPMLEHRYLRTEADRRRLRAAVRIGADLLRAAGLERSEPEGFVLGNDRRLDGWIAGVLDTASHLCGSAALGRVVDPQLRVQGIEGLRVADISVLPTAPRRGPASTAIMIGERATTLL